MAGRRLREAVKETLISSNDGEFDDETYVVIAGLTNTYSQYIATFEEYQQQRYEVCWIDEDTKSSSYYRPIRYPYLTEAIDVKEYLSYYTSIVVRS